MIKHGYRGVRGHILAGILTMAVAPAAAWADGEGERSGADDGPPLKTDQREYVEVNVSGLPTSNTIGTKMPVALQSSPLSVASVTDAVIREQQGVVLTDTFRNVSGINVQPGTGIFDYFVLRGFDSLSSAVVMTDGAQEPEAVYYPMYNVEGVEVLKAPSGFLYGPNGLAGAVNIVRKQPLQTEFLRLSAFAGSFNSFQGALDWNTATRDGGFAFRLNGLWNQSDLYRDDKSARQTALNPSFTWRLGGDGTINLNLEYLDSEFSPDAGIPLVNNEVPEVPRARSYQAPGDFSDQQLGRFQLDWEDRLTDSVKLRNKTYYRGLEWKSDGTVFNGTAPNPFVPGDLLAVRTLTRLDDRQSWAGNQFEAVFEVGSVVEHQLLAGLELAYLGDTFGISAVPPPNPLTPVPSPMPLISVFDPVETYDGSGTFLPFLDGEGTSTIVAPYVVDQMRFSPKWELMIGARYDRIDTEIDYAFHPVLTPQGQTPARLDRDDSKVSPMLGLVFAPNPQLSLYANAGQSFAPASFRTIGDLGPEESTQYEIGVKKQFLDEKLSTTFALYQVDRENIGVPDDTGILLSPGNQRSRGFEVELGAEFPSRLRTLFAYAYNDSELVEFMQLSLFAPPTDFSGNVAPFAPEHLASFWISKSFNNGFGVAGGPRYTSAQFIAPDNAFELDSYLLWDATVFWTFRDCRVNLQLKNLTNEKYETRGFGSNSVIPGNAFAAYVGFDYTF